MIRRLIALALLGAGIIIGQSLSYQTFQQPVTAAVPAPGAATLTANAKSAQTVNVADFELPDPTKSCASSSHDDGPAFNRAFNYVVANGGGTVALSPGVICYINSFASQVIGIVVPYGKNGLKVAGNNSTIILNSSLNGALFGVPPDLTGTQGYDEVPAGSRYEWSGATLIKHSTQIQLENPSDCANFTADDAVWIRGGYGLQTEFNAEVNKVAGCDTGTGILFLQAATAKTYKGCGSAVTWTASTAYAVGTEVIDPAKHCQVVTTAGTSGSSAPTWIDGSFSTDTFPPPQTGDGAGGISTTGTASSGSTTLTITGSTAGITNGMQIFAPAIQPNTTITISGSTVTLSSFAYGAISGTIQFFSVPPAVVWTDQGPFDVADVQAVTSQNVEFDDSNMIVSGAGAVVQVQCMNWKYRNVEMQNITGNQLIINGSCRNVSLDRARWSIPPNLSLTSRGAGGYQIAYNTVGVDVNNSDLSSQDWTGPPIIPAEFSAQINIHDSRLSSVMEMGAQNTFDTTYHHNKITINGAANTQIHLFGGFSVGLCCNSLDTPDDTIDDNDFDITMPTGGDTCMLLGSVHINAHDNRINCHTGGTGIAVDLGDVGTGSKFTGNVVITDNQGIVNSATQQLDWNMSNNTITRTGAPTALGTASAASSTITLSSVAGTVIVGDGVAGVGVPDGSYVSAVSGSTVTLNSGHQTLAALSSVPLVFPAANSGGIIVNSSTPYSGVGPVAAGNTISNFFYGIQFNGAGNTLFPHRSIGPNSFSGVATQYSPAGIAPIATSNTNTETMGGVCPYLPFADPGLVWCGRIYSAFATTLPGASGVTPTNDMQLVLESTGSTAIGMLSHDGAQFHWYAFTPSHIDYLGFDTGVSPSPFAIVTDNTILNESSTAGSTWYVPLTAPSVTATISPSAFAAGTTIGGVVPGGSFTVSNTGGPCSGANPHATNVTGALAAGVLTITTTCGP